MILLTQLLFTFAASYSGLIGFITLSDTSASHLHVSISLDRSATGPALKCLVIIWNSGELRPGSAFPAGAPRLHTHAACGFAVSGIIT